MKKIIVVALVAAMLLACLVPVSALSTTANGVTVKDYDSAAEGELLYEFNFAGDAVFQPKSMSSKQAECYNYVPSDDGKSITVTATDKCPESGAHAFWGGIISTLKCDRTTTYSLVYKVKANGVNGKNNRLGIGAWFNNKMMGSLLHQYGQHNSVNYEGGEEYVIGTILHVSSTKTADYVDWTTLGEYEEQDGFVTLMVEYNGPKDVFKGFVLAKGTDGTKAEHWLEVQSWKMGAKNNIPDGIGFGLYAQYDVVDTTVKDAKLYKGIIYEVPEETDESEPVVDTAGEGDVSEEIEVTEPVADDSQQSEEPAAEGGCGATVTFAGAATVAMLGACAALVSKKKRK